MCAEGTFFEVFRNAELRCEPDCSRIRSPGPASDCTSPWTPPIIGDLDGDTAPGCGPGCQVDRDDVAALCGATLRLPACDPTRDVVVTENADCSIADTGPGNGQCDLAPGVHGDIDARQGSRLELAGGTFVACSVHAGRARRVRRGAPATILVPDDGRVSVSNNAEVGTDRGALTIVAENGPVDCGRNAEIAMDVCAIGGRIGLGHGNTLRGHFVGDTVTSNRSSASSSWPRSTPRAAARPSPTSRPATPCASTRAPRATRSRPGSTPRPRSTSPARTSRRRSRPEARTRVRAAARASDCTVLEPAECSCGGRARQPPSSNSSSTRSDGRAITARFPRRTTGRSMSSGCSSSTATTCSRVT